mmetsp:Transcript_15867/g.23515  ORF Transcript_15867/g.23515 Transcript_15867/m.23515 type:complete len:88 (-) Transcript_15867:286-549(-)
MPQLARIRVGSCPMDDMQQSDNKWQTLEKGMQRELGTGERTGLPLEVRRCENRWSSLCPLEPGRRTKSHHCLAEARNVREKEEKEEE